jgi:hypothetical protein
MAILGTQTTSTLSTGGVTENNLDILQQSHLHDLASVTGQGLSKINPAITEAQPANPSRLSKGGVNTDKYRDNTPEGASF